MQKPAPDALPQGQTTQWVRLAECLYRHKSSGIHYGLAKRGGKQYRQSFKTRDRKLAECKLRTFREKIGRVTETGRGSMIVFEELAKLWLERIRSGLKPSSHRRREVSLNQLKRHFGKMVVRNISTRDCDAWVIKRGQAVTASTFNNERETLRLLLDYACRDGLLLDNPAVTIERRKQEKPQIVIPSRNQFRQLVDALRTSDCRYWTAADLIELLAYSGMRLGEANAITWGDIDFERDRFVVTGGEMGTKNHEARTVPLFPNLKELLLRLRQERDENAGERVIAIETAKKALANVCRRESLPSFSQGIPDGALGGGRSDLRQETESRAATTCDGDGALRALGARGRG